MKRIRNTIFAVVALGVTSVVGCSTGGNNLAQPGSGSGSESQVDGGAETGTLGFSLNLGSNVTVTSVTYTIANSGLPGFTTLTGTIDVGSSNTISASVQLPVGDGYTLTLNATDSLGDPCIAGPVTFSVAAGQSNVVALTLICTQTVTDGGGGPDVTTGSVTILGDASFQTIVAGAAGCAAATELFATASSAPVGNSIVLMGAGIDGQYQSSTVSLTWSASGGAGSLLSTSGSSSAFNCAAAGAETITLTAALTATGASCAGIGSLSVTLTCTGGPDSSVGEDSGSVTDGGSVPDSSSVEPDSGAGPDGGSQDAGAPDAALDSSPDTGAAASAPVPCTTASQTNCVKCDQNSNGLCTPTEAVILTRDIEKGLVSNNMPTAASCYECMANSDCIDSTAMGFTGLECGDLTTASDVQPCLDTLNCVLGSPQAGTAGATGTSNPAATSASLAADCTNAGDGVFNCFCGSNDISTTACGAAPSVSAAASNSPNGLCLAQVFAGTGTSSSTANSTIIADLSNVNLGAGQAFAIPICAGSNQNAGQACPQCYQ